MRYSNTLDRLIKQILKLKPNRKVIISYPEKEIIFTNLFGDIYRIKKIDLSKTTHSSILEGDQITSITVDEYTHS
jgi:hypothetical protein